MEKSKGGLGLDIVTNTTFDNDDIKETIIGYGQNFLNIEKELLEATSSPDKLAIGQYVPLGKIIWNDTPVENGYVGWINLRLGKHTPQWQPKKHYFVGEEIKASIDNGNVYQCVTEGRSVAKEPTYLLGNGVEFYDASGDKWFPNYNYQVNDVVFAENGGKSFYYICETAGFTGDTEPSWSSALKSSAIIDGSVVWRKEATIKWKQVAKSANFRPFGKIE